MQVGTTLLPTTFTYDTQGRLATQTQGDRTTTFEYDERGYLASVTDPLSRTMRFTNDQAGRRLSQTFPDLREATFSYDANGNLTSLTPEPYRVYRRAGEVSHAAVVFQQGTPPDKWCLPSGDAIFHDLQ